MLWMLLLVTMGNIGNVSTLAYLPKEDALFRVEDDSVCKYTLPMMKREVIVSSPHIGDSIEVSSCGTMIAVTKSIVNKPLYQRSKGLVFSSYGRLLAEIDDMWVLPKWSPNCRQIVYQTGYYNQLSVGTGLWLYNIDTGKKKCIIGGERVDFSWPAFDGNVYYFNDAGAVAKYEPSTGVATATSYRNLEFSPEGTYYTGDYGLLIFRRGAEADGAIYRSSKQISWGTHWLSDSLAVDLGGRGGFTKYPVDCTVVDLNTRLTSDVAGLPLEAFPESKTMWVLKEDFTIGTCSLPGTDVVNKEK